MKQLFNLFFDICLLRAAPQDVPYSGALLAVALACFIVVGTGLSMYQYSPEESLAIAVAGLGVMVVVVSVALQLTGHPERRLQTITALAGTDALITLFAWPVYAWNERLPAEQDPAVLPALLILALMIWNITVVAHIFRHALSVPMYAGVVLALGYFLVLWQVLGLLFAAPV